MASQNAAQPMYCNKLSSMRLSPQNGQGGRCVFGCHGACTSGGLPSRYQRHFERGGSDTGTATDSCCCCHQNVVFTRRRKPKHCNAARDLMGGQVATENLDSFAKETKKEKNTTAKEAVYGYLRRRAVMRCLTRPTVGSQYPLVAPEREKTQNSSRTYDTRRCSSAVRVAVV